MNKAVEDGTLHNLSAQLVQFISEYIRYFTKYTQVLH